VIKKIYEDFKWIIYGHKLKNFPERFKGSIEPKSKIEIYKAYLPMVFTKPGFFKVIIVSSKELTFNVVLTSPSDEIKIKEMVPKLAPILEVEFNTTKPQICKVKLPKYSLYIKVEVKLNPERLKPFHVIDKPWFIDVEVKKGIESILQRIDNPKIREVFIRRWGGKNVTVITIYVNNKGNKTLTILDWGNYDVYVFDIYKEKLVGYCGVKALVMKPFRINVEPGQQKPLIDLVMEYENKCLYINGHKCSSKLEPGKYILKINLDTKPFITVTMVVVFKLPER